MSLKVELHGPLWCIYQDGKEVFAGNYCEVEEWLDHAECSSKYSKTPDGTEPRITHFGRRSLLIQRPNAPVTSAKP